MSRDHPFKGRKLHFIGMGGAGMSGLAHVAKELGAEVTGSDAVESAFTKMLRARGLDSFIGHAAEQVPDGCEVVVSTAVAGDNPELERARQEGLRVWRRGEFLAEIARLKRCIAVVGTHGKTTTTAMAAHCLVEMGLDPAFVVGGQIRGADVNAAWGGGDWIVVEGDESDRSFLYLRPQVAVITSMELDHHTTYRSHVDLEHACREFVEDMPEEGVVAAWDRPELCSLVSGKRRAILFDVESSGNGDRGGGFRDVHADRWPPRAEAINGTPTLARASSGTTDELDEPGSRIQPDEPGSRIQPDEPDEPGSQVQPDEPGSRAQSSSHGLDVDDRGGRVRLTAREVTFDGLGSSFKVCEDGIELARVKLALPGRHNTLNAMAALTAIRAASLNVAEAAAALKSFTGPKRRFEPKGRFGGAEVFDDYAHHPTEVEAALRAARQLGPARLIAVFQPHLYSRTLRLAREFGRALALADVVVVLDVYPARERPVGEFAGVTGKLVVDAVAETAPGKEVWWLPTGEEALALLRSLVAGGDLVLTVGAGDVFRLGEELVATS